MKYFISVIFIICSFALSAQDFYINLQTGNGFATEAGQANYYNIDIDDNTETREIITGGFGEGLYFRGNFGYHYSSIVAFECGFNYLLGKTIINEENYNYSIQNNVYFNQTDYVRNVRAFLFTPQLALKMPRKSKLQPYVKTGIAVGVFMQSNFESNFLAKGTAGSTTIDVARVLDGGTPLGFTATLGANYLLSDNFALVADFTLLNMSYRPYKSTVVKYMRDGVDEYDSLTLREREILFNNKVETDNNTMPDDNEVSRALPISLPMSNISFNIGLQVNL